ncbi:hypothetical protein P3L10_019385 [Capsicum annuum]|uniref:uncharacterized protein LOC107873503 n=1 Tax=Capsicum annuum TaxID=4072 RepID=UPI001FB0B396|nr:uncharacterized protein LOC107873503 [Capsicum annuum]XP_016575861.2 uncharacterized protein LOC107873503 [Capsicum annuum]
MVRAKGKANKRSASAAVASEAALTSDSSEMENIVETGDLVETAVTEQTTTEQTMISVVAEEETAGAEAETLEEENYGSEEENDGSEEEHAGAEAETLEEENDGSEEENEGAEAETLEGELAKENEVIGGDETCTADKKVENAVGNDEGNNQETAIEKGGGKPNIDDKQAGDAAGINKDDREDGMEKDEDETNAKNKEEMEGSSKQKAKRLRRRNNRKRMANGTPQVKGENKQVKKKVAASSVKVGKDSGKLDSEVVDQSSKKVASEDKSGVISKDVNFEGKDKLEPLKKKKSVKKANSMGMIFMCNSETKKDCYRYKVLGLPANKKETVEKIYKGMRLFLYDVDLKLMYGIYKAAGRGGCNLQPKAFKSQFPSQVRFTVLEECLPLAEETFRQAIKKNYYTRGKFNCELSSEQVKNLCKLFTTAGKGSSSKGTQLRPETNVVPKRDRARKRARDERRRPDRARRSERVDDRRYREQVEDRRYREQVEDRLYREQVEDRLYREQVEDRVYREHPHLHERSLITSPLVPLAPLQPLPPTLVRDPYRQENVTQHNESHRQSRLVELPDAYRRDTVTGNPGVYRRQALVEPREYYRREGIPEHREFHQPMNLETRLPAAAGINDSYLSYRERLSYHDPVSSVRSQPEYNPPPAGLRSEYRHGGPSAVHSSARSILPEYPPSAVSSLYEYPRQPQYRY